MPDPALDYTRVAGIYDDYCVYDGDIEFFRRLAVQASGDVLELMSGTGRVSLPLARCGVELTCVDSSPAMLALLHRKLASSAARASVLCADVCSLPLRRKFPLVILPFHGFNELATTDSQLAALRSVGGVLDPAGSFVCTAHNPQVRLQTIDGAWHEFPSTERADGGLVQVSVRASFDEESRIVSGTQRVTTRTASGEVSVIQLDLRFSLISLEQLTELAREAGLAVDSVAGDLEGTAYDPGSSPSIVVVLRRLP